MLGKLSVQDLNRNSWVVPPPPPKSEFFLQIQYCISNSERWVAMSQFKWLFLCSQKNGNGGAILSFRFLFQITKCALLLWLITQAVICDSS